MGLPGKTGPPGQTGQPGLQGTQGSIGPKVGNDLREDCKIYTMDDYILHIHCRWQLYDLSWFFLLSQGDRGLPGEIGPIGKRGILGIMGMQGKQGSHGAKGQTVSVIFIYFLLYRPCPFLRDSKNSFGFFFLQGEPGERGLSGPLGNFGPKVRPLPLLSDDINYRSMTMPS